MIVFSDHLTPDGQLCRYSGQDAAHADTNKCPDDCPTSLMLATLPYTRPESDSAYYNTVIAVYSNGWALPLTERCPECGEIPTWWDRNHTTFVTDQGLNAVVIGCEGYYVINPKLVGLYAPNWQPTPPSDTTPIPADAATITPTSLNLTVFTGPDAGGGIRASVDLLGVHLSVTRTAGGTTVYVCAEETPDEHRPVAVEYDPSVEHIDCTSPDGGPDLTNAAWRFTRHHTDGGGLCRWSGQPTTAPRSTCPAGCDAGATEPHPYSGDQRYDPTLPEADDAAEALNG